MMTYKLFTVKRSIEDFFIYPFVLLGRVISLFQKKKEYKIYFLFPFYHVGGVEKLHYQIAQICGGGDCVIYFTRKSVSEAYYKEFEKSGCSIKNISKYTDTKFLYFLNLIFRGIVSAKINSQKRPCIVFNGQSNFAYKLSPWIKKNIRQIELIHAMNTFAAIRLPFLNYYAVSVTVNEIVRQLYFAQYNKLKIPQSEYSRFYVIESKVNIPASVNRISSYSQEFNILYVGRGTKEKRVHVVAIIAKLLKSVYPAMNFNFAGNVQEAIPEEYKQYCNLYGDIGSEEELSRVYENNHILIITSTTESGPLVLFEAMVRGLAVISTPVGFCSKYIINAKNGFLIDDIPDEALLTEQAVKAIECLYHQRDLLDKISLENIYFGKENFGMEKFAEEYKKLLVV